MPAWCAALNVRASFLIQTSNETPKEHNPFPRHVLRSSALARAQRDPPAAEAFGNSPLLVTGPKLLNLSDSAPSPSCVKPVNPCVTELLPCFPTTPSCGTDNALLFFQRCSLFLIGGA